MDGKQVCGLASSEHGINHFGEIGLGDLFVLPQRKISSNVMEPFASAAKFDTEFVSIDPFHVLLSSLCTSFSDQAGNSVIRLVSQSCRFMRAVDRDETLLPRLQVIALQPDHQGGIVVLRSTIHARDGELVLDGEQHYLMRSRDVLATEFNQRASSLQAAE